MNKLPGTEKLSFHLTRYKYFYENSTQKHNCTYAKKTKELFLREKELDKVLLFLSQIESSVLTEDIKRRLLEL